MSGWSHLLAVASGGAIGASARYGANLWFVRSGWYGLPAATFAVNVIGCLLAGVLLVWLDTRLHDAIGKGWEDLRIEGYIGGKKVIEKKMSAKGVEKQFIVT